MKLKSRGHALTSSSKSEKTGPSVGKVMASVFYDIRGIVIDYYQLDIKRQTTFWVSLTEKFAHTSTTAVAKLYHVCCYKALHSCPLWTFQEMTRFLQLLRNIYFTSLGQT
jgi:hypothetical protein